MIYAILQEDIPGPTDDIRAQAREAHKAYLATHEDRVIMAGPALSENEDKRVGSLTLLAAPDAEAARDYADNDPFTLAGLFVSTRIVRLRAGVINLAALQSEISPGR